MNPDAIETLKPLYWECDCGVVESRICDAGCHPRPVYPKPVRKPENEN